MKKIFAWVAAISIIWIAAGNFNHPEQPSSVRRGSVAPNFTLPTIKGPDISLSQAKGKPLVINFWNSWCPPCKEETPVLAKLYRKYKGKFQLYGINETSNDTIAAVKLFMGNFPVNYPVLLDESGYVGRKYRIRGMPTTYLIDRNGKIMDVIVGYQGKNILRKKILALLSK